MLRKSEIISEMELLRKELGKTASHPEVLIDPVVLHLSRQLDVVILKYYLYCANEKKVKKIDGT